MGKHGRRKSDDVPRNAGGDPILPEEHTVEKAVAHLQGSYGHATVRVADKRLRGEAPYDLEPGSKPPVR